MKSLEYVHCLLGENNEVLYQIRSVLMIEGEPNEVVATLRNTIVGS